METFLKYSSIAFAVQVLLYIVVVLIDGALPEHAILDTYLHVYAPFMLLIDRTGNLTGEAGMIRSILLGAFLGLFVYSLLAGAVGLVIKRTFR